MPLSRILLTVAMTLAALSTPPVSGAGPYDQHRLLRVEAADRAALAALEASGAVILNCIPAPGALDVVASPDQLAALQGLGLPIQVRHENFQALVDAERAPSLRATGDPFQDFFLNYHRYDDGVGSIVWFMTELVSRHPNLASMINVGTSTEGRTIWGLRLANDAVPGNKPAVFYYSCVHAREWVTTTVPPYFARHVLDSYATDPVIQNMVDQVEIFLVPVANPDGHDYTWTDERLWRKTRSINSNGSIGVDINRNWGEQWGLDDDGSSPNPGSSTYRGPFPFSEPETTALRDFFLAHPNIRAMLDIHSYTQLILWPWGYTPDLPPDQALYEQLGFAMRDLIFAVHGMAYEPGPVNSTIYPVNGASIDWTYAQLGVLSFSYELRPATGSFGSGFELDPAEIIPNNEEILPAMLYLTNTDFVRSPLIIAMQDEVPEVLPPGQDTVLPFTVTAQYESPKPDSVRLYYRYDPDAAFTEVALAPVASNSFEARLPATNCASTPEFFLAATGDAGSEVYLPRPAELAPFAPPVAGGVYYAAMMDTDPGWSASGEWAWGVPTGDGSLNGDPTGGHTGTQVYGYNLGGDYGDNLAPTYLTTAPIDCTGRFDTELRFWRWLGVESNFNFDEATVEVSADGQTWTVIWRATETGVLINDDQWVEQRFDISAVADDQPAVQLRWGMGPTDSSTALAGWNLDDVQLVSLRCIAMMGDWNGDGVVNAQDWAGFAGCSGGPAGDVALTCGVFDFNGDAHIDLRDFAALQAALSG